MEQRGAEVNQRDRGKGWTPLHRAARMAHHTHAPYLETFEYLLKHGADPGILTTVGWPDLATVRPAAAISSDPAACTHGGFRRHTCGHGQNERSMTAGRRCGEQWAGLAVARVPQPLHGESAGQASLLAPKVSSFASQCMATPASSHDGAQRTKVLPCRARQGRRCLCLTSPLIRCVIIARMCSASLRCHVCSPCRQNNIPDYDDGGATGRSGRAAPWPRCAAEPRANVTGRLAPCAAGSWLEAGSAQGAFAGAHRQARRRREAACVLVRRPANRPSRC